MLLLFVIGIVAFLSLPLCSEAVPVFARKYGYQCTMCHSTFPRLNDYGERYRQNGYQLPGRESEDKTILDSPPPFAVRTSGGYTSYTYKNTPDVQEINEFMMSGVDILSAGLLARNIGYLAVILPEIKESRGVEGQTGTLEAANIIFSNIGSPWLNLRIGRFEPGSTVFSVKRKLTVSPYEVYSFGAPGCMTLSDTQDGIELTGNGRYTGYTLGYLNGSESNRSDDSPEDVYARAYVVIGAGEGQTAGQRLGVVGYLGSARPLSDAIDGTQVQGDSQQLSRIGVDASFNLKQCNLALQYLAGEDDGLFWNLNKKNVKFTGGFAELSYMPLTSLAGFARYDWVDTPSEIDGDITRWTGGARYYFVNNLALHVEYSQRRANQPAASDAIEDFFAARLDFVF